MNKKNLLLILVGLFCFALVGVASSSKIADTTSFAENDEHEIWSEEQKH